MCEHGQELQFNVGAGKAQIDFDFDLYVWGLGMENFVQFSEICY